MYMNDECDNTIVVISNFTFCKLDILFTAMITPQPFLLQYQKRKFVHEIPKINPPKRGFVFEPLINEVGVRVASSTIHSFLLLFVRWFW